MILGKARLTQIYGWQLPRKREMDEVSMEELTNPYGGVDKLSFKGGAFMGKHWFWCTAGTWPLGELTISQSGIGLSLGFRKPCLRWDDVSSIKVKYDISLYIYHQVPNVYPYLVFTTVRADRPLIKEALQYHGYQVHFGY